VTVTAPDSVNPSLGLPSGTRVIYYPGNKYL